MLAKAKDALAMLWLNLDDSERRLLVIAGLWVGASAWLLLSEQEKRRERDNLKGELIAQLRAELLDHA